MTPCLPKPAACGFVRPRGGAPPVVRKRVLRAFARSPFPADIVVPSLQAVFDRVAVEVARGCPHKCRFCQAASLYAPYRVKDPDLVASKVFESCRSTGYEDASLFSLSVGDYPYLGETIKGLMNELERDRISLSLSSLRPKGLSPEIVRSIVKVRKTGFTLVPEAGSERLRSVINKNVVEKDLFDAAAMAFREGWRLLKLYFMIGLPTETEADLAEMVSLVGRLTELGRNILGSPPRIHMSVSSFIPKPHTPFQWTAMDRVEILLEKQRFLKREMRRMRNVEIKDHPVDSSVLEAVFSRGDRRLGPVLERAWELGCRFDGWRDSFRFPHWMRAFEECGIAMDDYLGELPPAAPLPWDHLATGVRREFLEAERLRAGAGERTPSCFETSCGKCRACDFAADLERSFDKSVCGRARLRSAARSARGDRPPLPGPFPQVRDRPLHFPQRPSQPPPPGLQPGRIAGRVQRRIPPQDAHDLRPGAAARHDGLARAVRVPLVLRSRPGGVHRRPEPEIAGGARIPRSRRALPGKPLVRGVDPVDVLHPRPHGGPDPAALQAARSARGWDGPDAGIAERLIEAARPGLPLLVEDIRVDVGAAKVVLRIALGSAEARQAPGCRPGRARGRRGGLRHEPGIRRPGEIDRRGLNRYNLMAFSPESGGRTTQQTKKEFS